MWKLSYLSTATRASSKKKKKKKKKARRRLVLRCDLLYSYARFGTRRLISLPCGVHLCREERRH